MCTGRSTDKRKNGKPTRCYKMSCGAVAKFMENAVTIILLHLSMDVVAGIAKLGDLLCKELHTINRVAKDD